MTVAVSIGFCDGLIDADLLPSLASFLAKTFLKQRRERVDSVSSFHAAGKEPALFRSGRR
jgi:hypothetical protein